MTAEQFAIIVNAKKRQGYWTAKCPAHADKRPSLSIRKGEKGKVLVRCFSGCDTGQILESLGLKYGDLYLDEEREAWLKKKRNAEMLCPTIKVKGKLEPLGPLEATYRYTNRNGDLVAEKLRFAGKVFLWRKPKIGGGWTWKVDRDRLPLYHLHEVIAASLVFLCEGEKDADAVRALCKAKAAATTAPNGAKSWKAEYAVEFKGKKVVIFPDSDAPGRKYAEVASRAIRPYAQCRIVSVAPSKDVADFLVHNSPAELSKRVRT